jgi:hypothetical protein
MLLFMLGRVKRELGELRGAKNFLELKNRFVSSWMSMVYRLKQRTHSPEVASSSLTPQNWFVTPGLHFRCASTESLAWSQLQNNKINYTLSTISTL